MRTTSANVYCAITEMLYPLNTLLGSCRVLRNKVPPIISTQMEDMNENSSQLAEEIQELRRHLGERVDVQSHIRAAEQIREIASGWKSYEIVLSRLISQIQAAGIRLEDHRLDGILNEVLPVGLEQLKDTIARLETIQSKELAPYDDTMEWINAAIKDILEHEGPEAIGAIRDILEREGYDIEAVKNMLEREGYGSEILDALTS